MAFESLTAAFFGLGAAMPDKKKESPVEPFRRTLALAEVEYAKAIDNLLHATEELAKLQIDKIEKKKSDEKK